MQRASQKIPQICATKLSRGDEHGGISAAAISRGQFLNILNMGTRQNVPKCANWHNFRKLCRQFRIQNTLGTLNRYIFYFSGSYKCFNYSYNILLLDTFSISLVAKYCKK